jgi:AraC-like DNA-binding protein
VTPPWFADALVHIDRNISRPISAADVVEVTGKSSTAVEKRFRAAFGTSVGKYILSLKMNEAARLIAEGRLSVKEIAARTGFNSPQYFCRSYRSYFGHSPLRP